MTDRPSRLASVLAGVLGAVWGLGLARLAGEAWFVIPLYGQPLAVLGVAVACGLSLSLIWWWLGGNTWASVPLVLSLLYVTGVVRGPLGGAVLLGGGALLTLFLAWTKQPAWFRPAVLALSVLGIYLRTLLPSIGQADTLEFQVVVPLLRVAHPTGYPLYILLTRLFTWIPFGNVAWRVNLASAVYATAATTLLYDLMRRIIVRSMPALLAAAALAFSTVFWSQALVAEVYALHNLLVALILWLLLGWRGAVWRWPVLALLAGMSLSNHLTTVLLFPALALGLLWERPRMPFKRWLLCGGLFALGVALYLYIPLRWPAINAGEWMSFDQFLAHITARQFQGALQWDGLIDPVRWRIVWRLLHDSVGWAGLALAGVGFLVWFYKRRFELAATGMVLIGFVLYGLAYHVPDISVFIIPATLVLCVWIGAGAAYLIELLKRPGLRAGGLALLAVLPLTFIWTGLPQVDQSGVTDREEWGRYVLSLPLEQGAAILADVEKFAPLYYLSEVEGLRSDLEVIILGEESLYRAELGARLSAGQPVYLARFLAHLEGYHLRSVGPLVEVGAQPFDTEAFPAVAVDEPLFEPISLLGYDLDWGEGAQTQELRVQLYWQTEGPVPGDYAVHFRLVDSQDAEVWSSGGTRPVSALYPTNAWRAGEVVADFHALGIPSCLGGGRYQLQVGLFVPFEDDPAADDSGDGWLSLGEVAVAESDTLSALPDTQIALQSGSRLAGYRVPEGVSPGRAVPVTLEWRLSALAQEADIGLGLAWVSADGQATGWTELAAPTGSARSVYSCHVLAAPAVEGEYTLVLGRDVSVNGGAGLQCEWLARPTPFCTLASVTVRQAPESVADFGPFMLVGSRVGVESVAPGDLLPVDLRWRSVERIEEDYTVTIQLIGPDGRLYGQVDSWPVEGTFPTSQWEPGQEVADPYQVQLSPDAPQGRYRVIVGWYLLETMERLPVLDSSGQPVADHIAIAELEIGGQ